MTAQTEQSELKRVMYSIPIDMLLGGLIVMYSIPIDMLLGGLIEEHYALQHYKSILFAPDKVTVGDFISKLNETRRIGTAMSYLRKIWIPQTGRGSQSEELSFNKALIAAMQESIAVRDAEIEQYAREEAEEEAKDAAEEQPRRRQRKRNKNMNKDTIPLATIRGTFSTYEDSKQQDLVSKLGHCVDFTMENMVKVELGGWALC